MNEYIVTLLGEVKEVYLVQANSEQEAIERWEDGSLLNSESKGMEVHSVRVDQ